MTGHRPDRKTRNPKPRLETAFAASDWLRPTWSMDVAQNRSQRRADRGGRAQIALGALSRPSPGRPTPLTCDLQVWVDPALDPVVSDEAIRCLEQLLGEDLISCLAARDST